MQMLNKIAKYRELDLQAQRLFLEAWVNLGIMRFRLLTRSFKRIVSGLDQAEHPAGALDWSDREKLEAAAIGAAITRAANNTPWQSVCLVQTLAGQKMLLKRNIPGVLYLGTSRGDCGDGLLLAHAWLRCGDLLITGGAGHEHYTVLSTFSWK